MNRLILLGNGFDLAHGMETTYNHFVVWYLKKCFNSAWNSVYKDTLIEVQVKNNIHVFLYDTNNKVNLIDYFYNTNFTPLIEDEIINVNGKEHYNPIKIKLHSDLFTTLLYNCRDSNWVDIENEYYYQLKEIIAITDYSEKKKKLDNLNQSMSCLIKHLGDYLNTLPKPNAINGYMKILTSHIKLEEVIDNNIEIEEPVTTSILNFNYTNTMGDNYQDWFTANSNRPKPEIINIHGKLNDNENLLIFGFGDELDEVYKKIEDDNTGGCFDYIKSFWYFRTSNYRKLLTILEAEPFQVLILGHSCGLSDRTMLNMIFEHDNCLSIKIYYHGDKENNNYTQLTHEIARHFTDKRKMRRRIVSLDASSRMPQWDEV